MKKYAVAAFAAAVVVCGTIAPAQADLNGELGGFFNSMGAAGNNITSPQAWQGQAATYVTGAGIYVRSANKTIQLASITLPSLNAGCGGIDAFLGSFSFISKDEFVAFAKNIISAAPGLFFGLGLKTVTPMLASAKDYLQQLASDVNSMNMSSCQAARGIIGGLWPGSVALRDRGVTCYFFTMLPDHAFDPKCLQAAALSRRYYCPMCSLVSGLCPEPA